MYCCTDFEYEIEVHDHMVTSIGTEHCVECGELIHSGEEHYIIFSSTEDWEFGFEVHLGKDTACEKCGDLALSVLEAGGCWGFGDLRSDIEEFNVNQ